MAKRTHKSILNLAKSVRVHKADGGETDPMLDQDTSIYDNPYKDQVVSAPEPMTVGQYLAQAMRKPHETNIRDFPQDFQNLAVVQALKALPQQAWESIKYPTMALKRELQWGVDPHTGQVTGVTESGMGPTEAGMVGAGLMSTGALPDVLAGRVTPNVSRVFAGPLSNTADLAALEKAQAMAAQGAEHADILKQTGWFQGADNKWRYEIPDIGSKVISDTGSIGPLETYMHHPDLYEAYPQIKDITTVAQASPPKGRETVRGSYGPDSNIMTVYGSDPERTRSTALHEIQHAIQDIEGFAPGSNNIFLRPGTPAWEIYQERIKAIKTPMSPEEFERQGIGSEDFTYKDYLKQTKASLKNNWPMLDRSAQDFAVKEGYKRSAGEVESRNVQTRRDMAPEELQQNPPWQTQDMPYYKQIISKPLDEYASSEILTESYKGQHEAPMKDSGSPLYNVTGVYPKDFYGSNGFRYYADFGDKMDRQTYNIIQDSLARPNKLITIYRAVPNDPNIKSINKGDWVTVNRNYAKDHGESALNGDYKIISKKVFARDLYTAGDSHHEWGYDPQPYINMNKDDKLSMKKDIRGFEEGGAVKNDNHSSGLDKDFMLHFLGSTKERLAKMSGQHTGKRKPSAQNAIDLAKHVMRTAHAFGGLAGRSHFESGGESGGFDNVDTTPAGPTENDYIAALDKIFQKNFGRPFDAKQDKYWLDQLKSGKEDLNSLATLETDIKSGAQGADKVSMEYTPTLQNLYRQYFGRDYNPETDSWWAKQLASGAEKPENLARDVLAGRQGKDLLYYNTYNTLPQDQPLTPVVQNPSRYVGMPTGRIDTTPAPNPPTPGYYITPGTEGFVKSMNDAMARNAAANGQVIEPPYSAPAPATQQYGTYAGQGTTPMAPQTGTAQNYVGTPWDIHAVQNYMSPNPMLGYQFNAPNLISAPLMTQHLANSGGAGMSNVPTTTTNVPTYTTPATDMTAFQKAYNDVMTNPDYVPTAKKPETATTQTPTYTNTTDALAGTTNPNTAAAAASYLASQAATDTGLPAQSFASPVNTGKYTPVDIPVSAYKYTPVSELPSTSAGYEANLASARANPVVENALQGAVAAGIPGFKVAKRGGRITKKNKPSTGAFIKKALVIVSKNKPKRPVSAG